VTGRIRFLLAASALIAVPVAAQIPGDTLAADTAGVLTQEQITKRYLEAQALNTIRLPVLPHLGVEGPRPPFSRIVIDRDSIDWSYAETVSELLQRTPGVYLWRGGWIGRSEYLNYQARGPTSVEYYLDGLPYLPVGVDSVGVDPSTMALSLLSRVEVERWPGLLRVQLFTRRHDRRSPSSRIGVGSGDKSIARYFAGIEARSRSGLGAALEGDYLNAPTASGSSSSSSMSTYLGRVSYIPSARFGAEAQLQLLDANREPFNDGTGIVGAPFQGTRSDVMLRMFLATRKDGGGLRANALFGQTSWDGGAILSKVRQGGVMLSYRNPTFGFTGWALNRSRWTPWDTRVMAGWTPVSALSLSAEGGYRRHDQGRESRWLGLRAGLGLPLGLQVAGAYRTGRMVAAPTILTDTAQRLDDLQGTVGIERRLLGLELGYSRNAAFQPRPYQSFPTIDSLRASGRTEWFTARWRVSPRPWLALEGWYTNPIGGSPDGQPPTHSLTTATIRSKFWRSFPSGIFDFKLQVGMESWSDGVIGRDPAGAAIQLDGATFLRSLVEIRLQTFIIYWDRTNFGGSGKTYVPGFPVPRYGSTFGVRWEFTN